MITNVKYIFSILVLIAYQRTSAFEVTGYLKTAPSRLIIDETFLMRGQLHDKWLNEIYLTSHQELNNFYFEEAVQIESWTGTQATEKRYRYRFDPEPTPLFSNVEYKQNPPKLSQQVYFNLNRAYLSYRFSKNEFQLGRQAVTLGSAKISSPFQIINSINILNFDAEQLDGVDAAIFKVDLGQDVFLRTGLLSGKENLNFLEAKKVFRGFSLNGYLLMYSQNPMYGVGITSNLWDAGLYAEILNTDDREMQHKNFQTFTLGLDYQFQNTLYFNIEYFYNGSGSKDKNNIQQFWFRNFKNQNYIFSKLNFEISPLLKTSADFYFNTYDQSTYSLLKLEYNTTENMYLSAAVGFPSYSASDVEFYLVPQIFQLSLKYFF